MAPRRRLDQLLVERGLFDSRERARRAVMANWVKVDGRPIDKPGHPVKVDAAIELAERPRFVGRGGLKLERALDAFDLDVQGAVCADIGASTGGFTDCLLQRGAAKVYAVDVGYGQLDWSLRNDARVVVLERTNARHLSAREIPEPLDVIVMDVSFISISKITGALTPLLAPTGRLVALIKPQFEAGPARVGKGGIVRAAAVHEAVLAEVIGALDGEGWRVRALTHSPVAGADGNREFLGLFDRAAAPGAPLDIAAVVGRAHEEVSG
ncbi:MAG TPA: TlyA family RNA methyltransferase [Limnochordia bacterium]|nr:TlyA family RNA methyltransferase [Limnochordia bacterium]